MSSSKDNLTTLVGAGSGNGRDRILPPGSTAPDFSLLVTPNQKLSLRELLGKPVILAFYPADWSPVCGDQMALYNEILPEFTNYNATLLGISVDGVWCHAAFAAARHLHFPLAADFEPKGLVARLYGAYREGDGTSERPFRCRPERNHRLELFVSGRRESRRGWYSEGVREINNRKIT
jgi:peroxiredoxin